MKDILKDIISHTYSLGFIDLVKITGTADNTKIEAIADANAVIIQAETHNPVIEFKDVTIGLPNLGKLDLHLKNPEYKENEKIDVVWGIRNNENIPVSILFENETGDFKNDYKLMSANLVNDKIKEAKFRGTTWQVEFEPTVNSIQRMKLQQSAHSEESIFMVKTEGTDFKIYFGDANTHEGNFVFQAGITGKLKTNRTYPISNFISILNLSGDKIIKFSDDGIILITVDSGMAKYNYYIPAMTK